MRSLLRTITPKLLTRLTAAAVLATALGACTPEAFVEPPLDASPSLARTSSSDAGQSALAELRAATAKYHRVEVAEADGYRRSGECVAISTGAMGIHYVNGPMVGNPAIDPLRPEVLVYEPQKNGKLQLVAVEFLVFKTAWHAANGPIAEPTAFGTAFFKSFGPAAHGLADHYELHVWIWRHNPDGMFAQWNPKVTCPTSR